MVETTPSAVVFKERIELARLAPVQRNLFTGEPEIVPVDVDGQAPEDETVIDDGISVVTTEDSAQLILSGFGLFLGKKSERLIVRKGKEVVYQFPFFRIQEVVIASRGISLSSDLLEELCVRGIRISFWGPAGKPYALVSSPHLSATVQTRREQLTALGDRRGFDFACAVVEGKIRNQEKLLRYFDRLSKAADSLRSQWKRVRGIDGQTIDEVDDYWHLQNNQQERLAVLPDERLRRAQRLQEAHQARLLLRGAREGP